MNAYRRALELTAAALAVGRPLASLLRRRRGLWSGFSLFPAFCGQDTAKVLSCPRVAGVRVG